MFTGGALVRGDAVCLYYGAADPCVALARARPGHLVEHARARPVG